MRTEIKQQEIAKLADQIKAAGYRVFIAERGTYGFYTNAEGSRVVSFQCNDFDGVRFSGNYKTNKPQSTGTGWQLATSSFDNMFNQLPPNWAIGRATWKYTTLQQHLAAYQGSSKYTEQSTVAA